MRALQRAIADACLCAGQAETLANDLRGFLEARRVAPDDIEAILAAPRRLLVYRSLVRNGLSSVVARILPRTRARMNAARPERFDADFARFVDKEGPRTHYLRDVPAEFFAWIEPQWRSDDSLPAYLADLASHELTHFAVAACASAREADTAPAVTLERPLAFIESARTVAYGWAVHELAADEDATDEPERRNVRLLAYRDQDDAVRWLDLTPLAAGILERLISGAALGAAVEAACVEHDTAPAEVLSDVARLLADLAKRGVIVGGKAENGFLL